MKGKHSGYSPGGAGGGIAATACRRGAIGATMAACAAAVLGTGPAAAGPAWEPPVIPLRIVRGYDPPAHNWLAGHRGVDLRTHPGQEVRSAGDGRVSFAAVLAGRGVVVVDHGDLRTTYEPVAASVHRGDRVAAGAAIGEVATGSGHCGAGTCLHFGVKRGAQYLDPRFLLKGFQAVLRPL